MKDAIANTADLRGVFTPDASRLTSSTCWMVNRE